MGDGRAYVRKMVNEISQSATSAPTQPSDRKAKFHRAWTRWIIWVYRRVPPGARTLVGLLILAGGILGFLPVLGFWMIPLGLVIISLDFRPLTRTRRKRRARRN